MRVIVKIEGIIRKKGYEKSQKRMFYEVESDRSARCRTMTQYTSKLCLGYFTRKGSEESCKYYKIEPSVSTFKLYTPVKELLVK